MSSTFQKDELTWRDILIRSAIVIITVIVVVWALPHDNISYFYVEEGKPWKYADFTAPFDFPIYKSEKAINEERAITNLITTIIRILNCEWSISSIPTMPMVYQGYRKVLLLLSPTVFTACTSKVLWNRRNTINYIKIPHR